MKIACANRRSFWSFLLTRYLRGTSRTKSLIGIDRRSGWREEEARGRATHEFLQTEFAKALAEIEAETIAKGYWEGELIHHRRSGLAVTVSSRWALRSDVCGKPSAMLESNRNST